MKIKLLLLLLCLPSLCFAETIQGGYCYTYGDMESLKEAREIARALAVRNAIESYRAFAESTATIKDFQLTNDFVQVLSSGHLKNIRDKGHSEKNRTVCDKIEAEVEPETFEKAVREEIGKKLKTTDKAGNKANNDLRLLKVFETDYVYYSSSGRKEYIEVTLKALRDIKNKIPVMIDFYDSSGNHMNGSRYFIGDLYKGEVRAIRFVKDPGSSSYRVWLPQ